MRVAREESLWLLSFFEKKSGLYQGNHQYKFSFIWLFSITMEKKSLILKNFSWDDVEVLMEITSYSNNNQLAILLYEKESWEYYCDLSVKDFPDENKYWDYIAVDINNSTIVVANEDNHTWSLASALSLTLYMVTFD